MRYMVPTLVKIFNILCAYKLSSGIESFKNLTSYEVPNNAIFFHFHNYCHSIHLTFIISNPKQPSCKKSVRPQKGHSEKRCEIQGGGQEMAVMVG